LKQIEIICNRYKRSLHKRPQDRCRLASGIETAEVKHIKWSPADATVELQLVETFEPTDHTMGTTSYTNLLLHFEEVCAPLKRAKTVGNKI
jgi:hypothetical protein